LQEEDALTRLLVRLPPTPVPSNFAARVQAAIDLDAQRRQHPSAVGWWTALRRLIPRLAAAGMVAAVGLAGVLQYQAMVRERLATSVASIVWPVAAAAQAAHLPAADILRDYDAIQELRRSSALADGDLLAALAPEVASP
jgi:hypothetical protein